MCTSYCYSCDYSHDETKRDVVTITDALSVKHYNNLLSADVKVISEYNSNKKLKLNHTGSVIVSFPDSSFEYYEYLYDVVVSKEPYNFYTLRAKDYNQVLASNLLLDEDSIIVKNTKTCVVETFDFFNVLKKVCDLSFEGAGLRVQTDKIRYKQNDTIKVNVYPSNIRVNVSYGGDSKEAFGSTTFTAKTYENRITAKYDGQSAEKIIFVSVKDRFLMLYNLFVLGFLTFFFYAVIRKYWGVVA